MNHSDEHDDEELVVIQDEFGEFNPGKPMFAGACFGFNVTTREMAAPLVTMFVEDDGCWHQMDSFDSSWIDDIVTQLVRVKKEYNV